MARTIISTDRAPAAIGTYSQAVRAGSAVYISGQIPLDPATKELVSGDMEAQVRRVFENLKAIAAAAGGSLANAVRVTIYLTDLGHFAQPHSAIEAQRQHRAQLLRHRGQQFRKIPRLEEALARRV